MDGLLPHCKALESVWTSYPLRDEIEDGYWERLLTIATPAQEPFCVGSGGGKVGTSHTVVNCLVERSNLSAKATPMNEQQGKPAV